MNGVISPPHPIYILFFLLLCISVSLLPPLLITKAILLIRGKQKVKLNKVVNILIIATLVTIPLALVFLRFTPI